MMQLFGILLATNRGVFWEKTPTYDIIWLPKIKV